MKKGIELPKETIDALLGGANMFIMPVHSDFVENLIDPNKSEYFMDKYCQLQVGDEFYVQEDFATFMFNPIRYKNDSTNPCSVWEEASLMTEELSRVKGKIVKIEVKRVQDINYQEEFNMGRKFEQDKTYIGCNSDYYKNKLGVDIKYEDNPYVFLYTMEKEG